MAGKELPTKNAGIEVIENILTKEATALNKRFFTFHTKKRPYIILNGLKRQMAILLLLIKNNFG
ncbi:MAG: hypothetical protein R2836_07360 [Chitinophagales bacterium]